MTILGKDEQSPPSPALDKQIATMPNYLDPSPLGTKEYWSNLYNTDLTTRQTTIPTHAGTTWFDDANAEKKTTSYLSSLLSPSHKGNLFKTHTSFLDLGTGNGSLLRALRKQGWAGTMIGVDYAEESVKLASQIWTDTVQNGWSDDSSSDDDSSDESVTKASTHPIHFHTLDIISLSDPTIPLPSWTPEEGFDIVLDKGTFDAVSLSSDIDLRTGKRAVELYARAASRFLKRPHGRMLVTSCNWTESELEAWFCAGDEDGETEDATRLVLLDRLPYRTFRFGGREGSVVVGLVFGIAEKRLP